MAVVPVVATTGAPDRAQPVGKEPQMAVLPDTTSDVMLTMPVCHTLGIVLPKVLVARLRVCAQSTAHSQMHKMSSSHPNSTLQACMAGCSTENTLLKGLASVASNNSP